MAGGEGRVGLVGVAVDQGPGMERVGHRAHLVLHREQHGAAGRVDDVLEAILIAVAFLGDQPALAESPVRARKVGDVNLDVMARPGGR